MKHKITGNTFRNALTAIFLWNLAAPQQWSWLTGEQGLMLAVVLMIWWVVSS